MATPIEEIQQMLDAGMSIEAVADELGITTTKVKALLKQADITPKKRIDEDAIVKAYQSELPVPDLLKRFELSYSQLYTVLNRCKVPLRKAAVAEQANARLDQAVKMYVGGSPLWQIKNETGIHQPTLHAALHERNIPLRRPRS